MIKYDDIYLAYLFSIIKTTEIARECKNDLVDLNKFLYLDENQEYLEKCMKEAKNIKELLTQQSEYILNNKEGFCKILSEFFN